MPPSAAVAVTRGERRDHVTGKEDPLVPERPEPERGALEPLDEVVDRLGGSVGDAGLVRAAIWCLQRGSVRPSERASIP